MVPLLATVKKFYDNTASYTSPILRVRMANLCLTNSITYTGASFDQFSELKIGKVCSVNSI